MSAIDTPVRELQPGELGPSPKWNRRDRLFVFVLVTATLALYFRTFHFDFVGYDDQMYVYQNPHILHVTWDSFHYAFTTILGGNWHPLTMLSYLLISLALGPNAGVYHAVNSLFHAVDVVLLYTVLRNCTKRPGAAFFTAALWGLHPLRVESVAWISELKDVLSGFFWFLSMLAYIEYSRRRTPIRYSMVALFLVLGLLVKPMVATLPAIFLLMDFWPLNRAGENGNPSPAGQWWTRRVLEKLPLIACGVADLLFAVYTQRRGVTPASAVYPPMMRLENGLVSYLKYLSDIFFPYHLTFFYPHPVMLGQTVPPSLVIFAAIFFVIITVLVFLCRYRQPYLLVGWLWFLGATIPVIGVVQVGEQARADRYTYLPSTGITLAVVWLLSDLSSRRRAWQWAAVATGTMAACALAASSFVTLGHWQNTKTLSDYARRVQPDNFLAVAMYCTQLRTEGHFDEACVVGKQAVELAPKDASMHQGYGLALGAAGRLNEAVKQFVIALHISPTDSLTWDALARVVNLQADERSTADKPGEQKLRDAALVYMQNAVDFDPDNMDAKEHLAYQLAVVGRMDEAIGVWRTLLDQAPINPQAHGELADALRIKSDLTGAVEHYRAALSQGAKNPDWETKLAYLVATNPQSTVADIGPMVAIAKDACDQTNNLQPAALDAYAACLARVGRFDDAVATAQQAVAQANANHTPTVALGIQKHLWRYQRGLSFVAGDE